MKRLLSLGMLAALMLLCFSLKGQADEPFIAYRAKEDVVYGHKDGMALTWDVLEPMADRNGIGLVLVSSGSWISKKSDDLEEEEKRRKYDHWIQGLLK